MRSADDELGRLKRLVASVPQVDDVAAPMHERVASLVHRLRKSEPLTRVSIQTLALEGAIAEKRAASTLPQPLPALPGAASLGLSADGTYVTRSGLEEFLDAGRAAGASITALSISDRRFQAGFRIYGRL